MGYGFVWSGPKPPVVFVEYEKRLAEYQASHKPDWRNGLIGYQDEVRPTEPEGYLQYPYKRATATVDYGRVLLEFGALTALLTVAWIVALSFSVRHPGG